MSEQEKDLLLRVKNSDKKAFQNLFSNYHDTLFRFVAYRVRDSDLAEDITQETFFRVWKKRSSLIPKKSFFVHSDISDIKKIQNVQSCFMANKRRFSLD